MLDFPGIGAPKAETTYLFKMLAMHSEVYFPLGKECHYWNTPKSEHNGLHRHYLRAFRQTDFADANGWKCGEITPAYASLPEDSVLDVKLAFPRPKVFYISRNPVGRIWSVIQRRMKITADNFEFRDRSEVLSRGERQIARIKSTRIDVWRARFDFHEMRYEDLLNDPTSLLEGLCRHLGISDAFYEQLPEHLLKRKVFSSGGLPPPPELIELVHAQLS